MRICRFLGTTRLAVCWGVWTWWTVYLRRSTGTRWVWSHIESSCLEWPALSTTDSMHVQTGWELSYCLLVLRSFTVVVYQLVPAASDTVDPGKEPKSLFLCMYRSVNPTPPPPGLLNSLWSSRETVACFLYTSTTV